MEAFWGILWREWEWHMGDFVGVKWREWRPFERSFFHQSAGFFNGNNNEDYSRNIRHIEASRVKDFQGKCFSWRLRNIFSHLFVMPKFYRWLIVAPHGDGIFLKVSRISEIIFGSRPESDPWPSFSSFINCYNHEDIISAAIIPQTVYLPILLS